MRNRSNYASLEFDVQEPQVNAKEDSRIIITGMITNHLNKY